AIIRNVAPEPYITVPPGIDVTLNLELKSIGEPFKKDDYVVDIDPPSTDVKSLTSLTDGATIEYGLQQADDRFLKLSQDLPVVQLRLVVGTKSLAKGGHSISVALKSQDGQALASTTAWINTTDAVVPPGGPIVTSKDVVPNEWTDDVILSAIIKKGMAGLSFKEYKRYMDFLLCGAPLGEDPDNRVGKALNGSPPITGLAQRRFLPFNDTDAYRLLKVATEAFVAVKSTVCPRDFVTNEEMTKLAASINAVKNLP